MNNFEIQGVIHEMYAKTVHNDKFKKREFVLRFADGAYEQHVKFQLINNRCDLIDKCRVGDEIKVNFNLSGKPYQKGTETIYFTNLTACKIEKVGQAQPKAEPQKQEQDDDELGDLPF